MNKKIASEIAIGIILLIGIIFGLIFWMQNKPVTSNQETVINNKQTTSEKKACTQEAKMCDDGSYVSRTGPNCEFASCPEKNATKLDSEITSIDGKWNLYMNNKLGFSMKIPKKVSTKNYRFDVCVKGDEDSVSVLDDNNGNAVFVGINHAYDNKLKKCLEYNLNVAKNDNNEVEKSQWEIDVINNVNNEQELGAFVKGKWGKLCGISMQDIFDQKGAYDVTVTNIDNSAMIGNQPKGGYCIVTGPYVLKYLPEKKKLVYWEPGQDIKFSFASDNGPEQTNKTQEEIIKSFKFIN